MYDHERDELVSTLRKHFTSISEGDCELMWAKAKGLDLPDMTKAIEEHRLECGKAAYRPDIRRLISMAIEYRNAKRAASSKKYRSVDWIRSTNPAEFVGVDDVSVIDDHYRNCYAEIMEDANINAYGRQMARAYILSHARNAFREIGLIETDGEKSARAIVGLAIGESISGGQMFRKISPLKSSWEEAKRLAEFPAQGPVGE
jgi:hypothetical protein